jgi:hypothetical protein
MGHCPEHLKGVSDCVIDISDCAIESGSRFLILRYVDNQPLSSFLRMSFDAPIYVQLMRFHSLLGEMVSVSKETPQENLGR